MVRTHTACVSSVCSSKSTIAAVALSVNSRHGESPVVQLGCDLLDRRPVHGQVVATVRRNRVAVTGSRGTVGFRLCAQWPDRYPAGVKWKPGGDQVLPVRPQA
jgi:FlaA1/EpsC-like NDP-sugar epimerase